MRKCKLTAFRDDETLSWPLLLALLAWGNRQYKIPSMSRRGTRSSGIPALPSSSPEVLCASSSSPPAVPVASTMEAPAMLGNGNAGQSRSSACFRAVSYVLICIWVIISALVPIIFCLLYYQQARGTCWAHGSLNDSPMKNGHMSWNWISNNCNGVVENQGQNLTIQQTGKYFVYAQLFRKETTTVPLALMLFKNSDSLLTNALGHENGTINFARPFLLNKGDRLHLQQNDNLIKVLKEQTYWGLFKM